jgi:hypothetical protein
MITEWVADFEGGGRESDACGRLEKKGALRNRGGESFSKA